MPTDPLPERSSAGTCFGFSISSPLEFEYLRGGDGDHLTIVESPDSPAGTDEAPILEWASDTVQSHARLYGDGDRYRLWVDAGGWFVVETSAGRITVPVDSDRIGREERLWGLPAVLAFIGRGDVPLHAAAVEVDGEAVILGGPGGSGKTTLATAFVSAGFRLLSDDVTCIRIRDVFSAIPGPALLRVPADVANAVDIENAGVTAESAGPEARVHFSLDPDQRGDCSPVPIRAIVLLRSSENGTWLDDVAPTDALRDLWPLSFRLPFDRERGRSFGDLADLVKHVPISDLYRPSRIDALPSAVEAITARVR